MKVCDPADLFRTERGKTLFDGFLRTVRENGMDDAMRRGVLVGFSGGADSVTLLLCLLAFRAEQGLDFPIAAAHLHHGIRGAEADRDLEFCKEFCTAVGTELIAARVNVPQIAEQTRRGLEETARDERYAFFGRVLAGRGEFSCVAVAHHATDQVETVLYRLMRGAGTKGLSGMRPVRGNILRPLIGIPKRDITAFLEETGVPFVTDSTNGDDSYARNRIRNRILPLLSEISASPEESVARAIRNLNADADFIERAADDFLTHCPDGCIPYTEAATLHPSLLVRVLERLSRRAGAPVPEEVHVRAVRQLLLRGGDFSMDLPGKTRFVCRDGVCCVRSADDETVESFESRTLEAGANIFDSVGVTVFLDAVKDCSAKVYKNAMQADLSSAIIKGKIYVRPRADGDAWRYGGMTHKLKKLMNDLHVPLGYRTRIPVFCDESGVLWVPGAGVRDDGGRELGNAGPYLTVECGTDECRWFSLRDFQSTQRKEAFVSPKAKKSK